jgi:hypothetical protein
MSAYSEAEEIQVRLNIADEASLLDRYITELKDGSLQLRLTSSVLTFNHTFVNGHPRDMHIAFVAHSHTYIFSPGSPQERVFPLSVSLVWAKYVTPFDALATVDKYYEKWARDPAGKYFDLISELSHRGVRRNIISEKILSMWVRKGHLARAQGTYVHRQIELALADEIYDGKDIEISDKPGTALSRCYRDSFCLCVRPTLCLHMHRGPSISRPTIAAFVFKLAPTTRKRRPRQLRSPLRPCGK